MHTLICVIFFRLGVEGGGWLRILLVALPVLFYLPFYVSLKIKHAENLNLTAVYFNI